MNSLKQMNLAMRYIEERLTSEIDPKELSRIACCSEYHFRRMFSFLSGMPLGEYIRRRRLAAAAALLKSGGKKIIDLALEMGYESPDSFSKAFQNLHGVTPSQAKKNKTAVKAFPPMTFQLKIAGGIEMEYRIVHKTPFWIVGLKKRITLQFEGVNPQMNSVVEKLTPEIVAELKNLCDTEPRGMLNISVRLAECGSGGCGVTPVEGAELDQYIGVATTGHAPVGYDVLPVDESDWAVFTVVGAFPKAVQDTWARIYAEWFPSSEYELTGGPEMLWFESPDLSAPDCKNEIWVPVIKAVRQA